MKKLSQVKSLTTFDNIVCFFTNNHQKTSYEQDLEIMASSTKASSEILASIIADETLRKDERLYNYVISRVRGVKNKSIARIVYEAITNAKLQNGPSYKSVISSLASSKTIILQADFIR